MKIIFMLKTQQFCVIQKFYLGINSLIFFIILHDLIYPGLLCLLLYIDYAGLSAGWLYEYRVLDDLSLYFVQTQISWNVKVEIGLVL